ncbi:hypothetical protein L1987_16564 [Smallanthus sonchifolius]|uniref:Uncharacterized protein n=1 Tax=Smallanthus sonchifolius TaxID=185202 RepID=A0ACB9IUF6_9ASTR|nr:hypothetical protein L1987_16564 [Smallanthus sonchifolius]
MVDRRTAGATPGGQGTNPFEVEMEVVDPKHSSSELNKGGPRSREEPNLSSGQGMGCSMSIPAAGGPRKSFSDPTQATAMETSDPFMEGSTPVPSSTAYGVCTYSPRRDGSAIQAIIWDAPNSQFSLSERSPMRDDDNSGTTEVVINPKGYQAPHAVNTTNDPGVDSERFTVVNRRKKRNGIKVQNKKQKSVMIKPINQQNKHSQKHDMLGNKVSGYNIGTQSVSIQKDTSNQVNAKSQAGIQISGGRKSKGFDFSRAINGSAGTPKPAQHVHKSSTSVSRSPSDRSPTGPVLEVNGTGCKPLSPPCSSTVSGSGTSPCDDHFAPVQHGSNTSQQPKPLVANQQIDTHNRFLVLDFQKSLKYNKLVGDSLDSCMMDQFSSSSKVLDKSNETGPKENLVCQEKETKDYGISTAQKMAITNRLCGPSQAVRAVDMDNWEQGEHEFFEDQVKALGLDYDYCIEDVESDDENGTAQFFAAQMKVGMPRVPLPNPFLLSK